MKSIIILALSFVFLLTPAARAAGDPAAVVSPAQIGATIQDVSIDAHGAASPSAVTQYLTMHTGDTLTQAGIARDYANLVHVAGCNPALSVTDGDKPNTVRLHWDVTFKIIAPTYHPFYSDKPLTAPFQGIGFVATSPALDRRGTNFSAFTQLARRADLFSGLFTVPLHVNAAASKESDLIVAYSAGKGVYRQIVPPNKNVFSWANTFAVDYWLHNANDTQFETGVHYVRTTSQLPSGLESPFLFNASKTPTHNVIVEAGLLHGCVNAAARWYPPNCSFQYRVELLDGIGGFGATSKFETLVAGAARYYRAWNSAVALQGTIARSGGVLPDSFVTCAGARAYPKSFCGTDAQLIQVEYRINDTLPQKVKFILFFDDAASRIRGEILPQPTSQFQWHDDFGMGVAYKSLIRIDLAYNRTGGRITFALQGQTF